MISLLKDIVSILFSFFQRKKINRIDKLTHAEQERERAYLEHLKKEEANGNLEKFLKSSGEID